MSLPPVPARRPPSPSGLLLLLLLSVPAFCHDLSSSTPTPWISTSDTALVGAMATGKPPPAPPGGCPPSCTYNTNGPYSGCGKAIKRANGSMTFECPPALLYSAGFDTNMVLQRDASAAVYGQMLGHGAGATVKVTVRDAHGASYTVPAVVMPPGQDTPTYTVTCWAAKGDPPCVVANYTASWKALLRPAPAGGEYTVTATCTAGCTGDAVRDSTTIERVTMGDVYVCGGQSNMQLPNLHSYSAKTLQQQLQAGKYAQFRWFMMIGGHQYEEVGKQGSYTPVWTRQSGVPTNYPYTDGAGVLRQQSWWNASYGGGWPKRCQGGAKSANDPACKQIDWGPFFTFSAACTEFARNLLEQLGDDAPPIGLIQSAVGGTTIEAWSPNATTAGCQNKTVAGPTASPADGRLFYGMIAPFVNTTVAGWLWYQGENNMHGSPGSVLSGEGYGCMMAGMVAAWREIWSVVPNTTHALAPFGVVTIAPSGSEGAGNHLSAFRWAQTANYGVLPNPRMPNTFVAQAYDLNDPWAGEGSRDPFYPPSVCSSNASLPNSCTWTDNGTKSPPPCCECGAGLASPKCVWDPSQWNKDLQPLAPLARNSSATPQFMGSLHPRLKEPVGRRLAAALMALHYGGTGTVTGPTVAGCSVDSTSHTVVVRFNKTLLKGDAVVITRVQTPIPLGADVAEVAAPNLKPPVTKPPTPAPRIEPVTDSSLMHVCTGDVADCGCLSWKSLGHTRAPQPPTGPWVCEIPAAGGLPRENQTSRRDVWSAVPITLLSDGASISVDTGAVNVSGAGGGGGIHAIKFGWSFLAGTCCIDVLANTGLAPCIPGSCGVMTRDSLLPLNPFFATVEGDKCRCPLPQTCDE